MEINRTRYFQSTLGVFQGGGCRAIAFAGAYEEAQQSGVNFAEVAGTSAGSIAAALIAAGATPERLREILTSLDFSRFAAPRERKNLTLGSRLLRSALSLKKVAGLDFGAVIYDEGMYSSEYIETWLDKELQKLLSLPTGRSVKFKSLQIPLSVVATDISNGGVKVWNSRINADDSVAAAVRASCTIPVYFQPAYEKFVDGGALSNLPSFVFSHRDSFDAPLASRLLAFSLVSNPSPPTGHVLARLAEAIVDGNQEIQDGLQGNVPTVRIPTGDVKATDFSSMSEAAIAELINNGRTATRTFFSEEALHVKNSGMHRSPIQGPDELNSHLIEQACSANSLTISETDCRFVFPLFPTLLHLRLRNARVTIHLPQEGATKEADIYKERLLQELGCTIHRSSIKYRAYIFDEDSIHASAFVRPLNPDYDSKAGISQYHAPEDAAVIHSLSTTMRPSVSTPSVPSQSTLPKLEEIGPDAVIERLRHIKQYSSTKTQLSYRTVETSKLFSLARYGREFKVKQIDLLHQAFESSNLHPFTPSTINLQTGNSIITPPVVEAYGNKLLVIEGTSRAIYLRNLGAEGFPCILVENASGNLPSGHLPLSQVRIVGRTLGPDDRYDGWNYADFRHIESEMHKINDFR